MDELLKKYKIEEISKRTSISPAFLQKLVVEKFDKIDKLKFKGFLKILKSEFKDVDFSELEEKANNYYFISDDSKKTGKQKIVEELDKNDKRGYKGYFFVFILIIIIGVLLSYMKRNEKIQTKNNNTSLETLKVEKIIEKNDTNITDNLTFEENKSEENESEENESEENKTILTDNIINVEKNSSKKYIDTNLTINPLRLVWFKIYYLDLNKSKEFLISNAIELNASKKMFIKFGHGMVKLFYNGKTMFPNSKRVTRVILNNGEMNITNKKVKNFR